SSCEGGGGSLFAGGGGGGAAGTALIDVGGTDILSTALTWTGSGARTIACRPTEVLETPAVPQRTASAAAPIAAPVLAPITRGAKPNLRPRVTWRQPATVSS